jgi:hypothetical protein
MKFSDRLGITEPKSVLQADSVDVDLQNVLWEACSEFYINTFRTYNTVGHTLGIILKDIYVNYFKQTSDNIEFLVDNEIRKQKEIFYELSWYEIYNFIEFLSGCAARNFGRGENTFFPEPKEYDHAFRDRVNYFLEREKAAYRFVGDVLIPISSELEIASIEEAMSVGDEFAGARSHIKHAVALYGRKPESDYRNAVKEAISAVESAVRVLTGDAKATLGDGLKILDKSKPLHPAFKQAMEKLYGYTSDEGGIRHSLIDLTKVDEADAKFMIVTCSAFLNFCVQRS